MTSIKGWAVLLTKALEERDIATVKRCRTAIVSALADNDYMINSTENFFEMPSISDNLLVGKSLTIRRKTYNHVIKRLWMSFCYYSRYNYFNI